MPHNIYIVTDTRNDKVIHTCTHTTLESLRASLSNGVIAHARMDMILLRINNFLMEIGIEKPKSSVLMSSLGYTCNTNLNRSRLSSFLNNKMITPEETLYVNTLLQYFDEIEKITKAKIWTDDCVYKIQTINSDILLDLVQAHLVTV